MKWVPLVLVVAGVGAIGSYFLVMFRSGEVIEEFVLYERDEVTRAKKRGVEFDNTVALEPELAPVAFDLIATAFRRSRPSYQFDVEISDSTGATHVHQARVTGSGIQSFASLTEVEPGTYHLRGVAPLEPGTRSLAIRVRAHAAAPSVALVIVGAGSFIIGALWCMISWVIVRPGRAAHSMR